MIQVKTQNKVLALVMTMAMAVALSLALAPSAFAIEFNDNVTIKANGLNGAVVDTSTSPYTYTTVGIGDPAYVKSEPGQYVQVELTFENDMSDLDTAAVQEYFQTHTAIAGRNIDGTGAYASTYQRDVFGTTIDENVITFNIGYNKLGTTANYNGRLYITAEEGTDIGDALGADVETLIRNGVTILDNSGVAADDPTLATGNGKARKFTVATPSNNRGMIHILALDGDQAIFNGTGTFSEGGFTIHAHTFMSQNEADFASLICSTANGLGSGYTFTLGSDGDFTVSHNGASCANVKVFTYDYKYLNDNGCEIGEIHEGEYQND